jgi:predicted nucleic acid-binding protein
MAVPKVLFDTTILVDLLERKPKAIARLRALAENGAQMAISIVSMAEVHAGVLPGEEERTARLLDLFDILPLTETLAKKAGELAAARRRLGRGSTLDDMMIAATALEHGYQLYTTNKKDFETPKLAFYAPER